jgi:hypothetical protein
VANNIQDRIARIRKEVSGVHSLYGFKNADDQFLRGLEERKPATLSDKQATWLADIEERVFGE